MCIWHPKPYNVFTYVVWKTLLWISCFAAKVLSFQFELPRPCDSHVKISNLLDSCFAWKQESHLDKTNDLEAGQRILRGFFLSMQKNLNIDLWTQGIPGAQRNFRLPAPGNLPACLADNPKFQMSWAPEVGTALGIWAPEWWWQQPTLSSLLAKVAGFWFSWNKHYGC